MTVDHLVATRVELTADQMAGWLDPQRGYQLADSMAVQLVGMKAVLRVDSMAEMMAAL